MAVLHHLQNEARRHREGCDQGDVDSAAQHDDRHGQAKNAEHSDVLQQGQHIGGAEEPREEEREHNEQGGEDREYDLLLSQMDAALRSLGHAYLPIIVLELAEAASRRIGPPTAARDGANRSILRGPRKRLSRSGSARGLLISPI